MKAVFAGLAAFGCAAAMAAVTPNDEGILADDDSASIQNAVDRAVATGDEVVIPAVNARTGKAGWEIARTVLLPSGATVIIENATLTMAKDVYANFFRSANTFTDKGRTTEGEMRDIRIIGRGRAVLSGGEANDLNESTQRKDGRPITRCNTPILMVNVRDFLVSGLRIEDQRYWGMCFNFCRFGTIRDIRFVARYDRRNQDGINLRNGCHDILVENISGQTGDDLIALSGIDALQSDDPWSLVVKGRSPDIHHIRLNNISGAASRHPLVTIRNHDGVKVYNVAISGISDTDFGDKALRMDEPRYCAVMIGCNLYWKNRRSRMGETYGITVRDLDCSYSEEGVVIGCTLKDSLFSGIRCSGRCRTAVTTAGPEWESPGAQIENVTVENAQVTSDRDGAAIVDFRLGSRRDYVKDTLVVNSSLEHKGVRTQVARDVVNRVWQPSDSVRTNAAPPEVAAHFGVSVVDDDHLLVRPTPVPGRHLEGFVPVPLGFVWVELDEDKLIICTPTHTHVSFRGKEHDKPSGVFEFH